MMEDWLWGAGTRKDPVKVFKCLVCDQEFKTDKNWRTCARCKDNQADREKRQYGEASKKW